MSDNLALWHSVERTDPSHTKAITGKPYKGNSPKPYYLVRKATEQFGPCGIGWGFTIVSERVEDGAPGDKVHIAHVRVWYILDGKRGEVEHVGQTMFSGKNKNGPFTDEDAPKKSITDALVKALSMIGFAGDIFIGRFDDSKYVDELKEEFREADANEERSSMADRYVAQSLTAIAGFDAADQLSAWWSSSENKRARTNMFGDGVSVDSVTNHEGYKRLRQAVESRIAMLKSKQKEAA
jgi:hypothetical protein